jgi:hypothetical protein
MNSLLIRRIIMFIWLVVLVLLIVDLSPDIQIFNLYDRFHPMLVLLVWAMITYIVAWPGSPPD